MKMDNKHISDMTVGSPTRGIIHFAWPLILGYILQQMYLIIDAAIVGRWLGVSALAAVGASSSIMFLVMGFCNGACAGFAIPVAQAFGAKDYRKMRVYVANATDDIYVDRQVRMMVENGAGEIVGIADVVNFDPGNCRAEVGLIVLDAFRRQGYGSSILSAVADYAVSVLHLHQLYAFCDVRNEASLELFRKMGYQTSMPITDWLYDGREYHNAILMQLVF